MHICVCVCVCVKERESETERQIPYHPSSSPLSSHLLCRGLSLLSPVSPPASTGPHPDSCRRTHTHTWHPTSHQLFQTHKKRGGEPKESRWRRNRTGDHFLFYKFIERTTERRTKSTKQLLIASSGHQAPRKAAHCLRREGKKFVFLCFSSFFSFFFSFFSFACFSLLFPFKIL